MAKDVITVHGKDVIVREDTAKAFRFVHWGVITAAICLAIMVLLFFIFFWKAASSGPLESPAQTENSSGR